MNSPCQHCDVYVVCKWKLIVKYFEKRGNLNKKHMAERVYLDEISGILKLHGIAIDEDKLTIFCDWY
jgi:hypothetical protein